MSRGPWTNERRERYKATIAARGGKCKYVREAHHNHIKAHGRICACCRSFKVHGRSELTGSLSGNCHAHPPCLQLGGTYAWPAVCGSDSCGEWKKK